MWVKIDDHFDEHPKLAAAGPLAWALWFAGLAYCNRGLTDGFIPRAVVNGLVNWEWEDEDGRVWVVGVTNGSDGRDVSTAAIAETLLRVGLWDAAPGGYTIHDYNNYQPTKEQVLADREAARSRMARVRSGEQRANGGRTKPEVHHTPYPGPVPYPNGSLNPPNPPGLHNGQHGPTCAVCAVLL